MKRRRKELFIRCDICDRLLTEAVYNRDHQKWEPCKECQEVIQDTLSAFRDRPSVDEDELGFGSDDLTLPLDDNEISNLPEY